MFLLQTSCHLQKAFQATHFERNSVNPNSMASLVVLFPSFLLLGQRFRQRGLAHFLLYSALSFHTLRTAHVVGPCSERALRSVMCAKMAMVWHSGSGDKEEKGPCSSNFWQESPYTQPSQNDSRAGYPVRESGLPVAKHHSPRLSFSPLQLTGAQERGADIKTRHCCS